MKWLNPGIAELFDSGYQGVTVKSDIAPTGFYTVFEKPTRSLYKNISASEFWFSYDFKLTVGWSDVNDTFINFLRILDSSDTKVLSVMPSKKEDGVHLDVSDKTDTLLYTSDKTFLSTVDGIWHNIEFHVKTGENGRIDM